MAVTVLDSKDLIEHLTTGETPVPAGIAEDNAKQKAAAEKEGSKAPSAEKPTEKSAEEPKKEAKEAEADDVEDADGLTPRQKRELSATMLKAIGKKHREMKEAEEFAQDQYNNRRLAEQKAEAEEQKRVALEAELAKLRQPVKEEAKEPRREDFATEDAYRDAVIDFKVDQKLRKTQAEEAAKAAQEEQARVVQVAEERLKAAAELVPDFEEVRSQDIRVPGYIAAYMQRSPLFAELGYHFAKHPDVVEGLRKLTPAEALVEVGVIKSTLRPFSETHKATGKANGEEPSSKPNGATAPSTTGDSPSKPRGIAPVITPLSSGSASQVEKAPEQMSTREMIQAWQKKEGRNLGLRKRH